MDDWKTAFLFVFRPIFRSCLSFKKGGFGGARYNVLEDVCFSWWFWTKNEVETWRFEFTTKNGLKKNIYSKLSQEKLLLSISYTYVVSYGFKNNGLRNNPHITAGVGVHPQQTSNKQPWGPFFIAQIGIWHPSWKDFFRFGLAKLGKKTWEKETWSGMEWQIGSDTVDGWNPAPVEVGSFSHYL